MSEDLLKKALEEAIDEDMSFIPKRQKLDEMHEFSEIFDRKIRKLAKKNKFHFRYQKTLSAVAACLAVVILAGVFSRTILSTDKSYDNASSESIVADRNDGAEEYADMTETMENDSASSESMGEQQDKEDAIANSNGIDHDGALEEDLKMGLGNRQDVEESFVEEQLKQCQEIVCKNYQTEETTCHIWLEREDSKINLNTEKCTIYLCAENSQWYQYTASYIVQEEESGEIQLEIEEFPDEVYTSLYVIVEDIAIIVKKK